MRRLLKGGSEHQYDEGNHNVFLHGMMEINRHGIESEFGDWLDAIAYALRIYKTVRYTTIAIMLTYWIIDCRSVCKNGEYAT